jgi:hypothetical protein
MVEIIQGCDHNPDDGDRYGSGNVGEFQPFDILLPLFFDTQWVLSSLCRVRQFKIDPSVDFLVFPPPTFMLVYI